MFVIHFFDCNVSRENLLFVSLKHQTACQLNTFNSNWWLNSPREAAVDIVLDVSENSHANVYSDILSEVVAYQNGIYYFFQIKILPDFQNTEEVCRGDLQEYHHLHFIYISFKLLQQWFKVREHASLLKMTLHHSNFLKNFTITSVEQRYWKMHRDGCF